MELQIDKLSKKSQLLIAIFTSLFLGWYVVHHFFITSIKMAIVLLIITIIAFVGVLILKRLIFTKNNIMENMLHLLIFSSFLGPSLVLLRIGPVSLFPFRLLFMLTTLLIIYNVFTKRSQHLTLRKDNTMLLFFTCWIFYAILSILWSESIVDGVKDLIFLAVGIGLVFFVTLIYKNGNSYLKFYYIWLIMHSILVFIGLINHFLKIHLPISRIYTVAAYQKHIPTAVFNNENDYASYLAISIFFVVSLVHYSKSWLLKIAGLLLILLSFYLILETASRANIIAVLLSFLFWFLLMPTNKTRRKLLFGCISVLPLILILFSSKVIAVVQDIFFQLESLIINTQVSDTGSVSIRVNQLKNAFIYFRDSYGFGIGPGNAGYYLEHNAIYPVLTQTNLHNWWIEILVNYGFIIFTLYVIVFLSIIFKLVKHQRKSKEIQEKMISEGLTVAVFTFILASISPSSMMALNYTWVLMAFAVGYLYSRRRKIKQE